MMIDLLKKANVIRLEEDMGELVKRGAAYSYRRSLDYVERIDYNIRRATGFDYITQIYNGDKIKYGYVDFESYKHFKMFKIQDGYIPKEKIQLQYLNLTSEYDVAFDIGGYQGVYTLILRQLNPNIPIIVFEPSDVNHQQLEKVLDKNNIQAELRKDLVSNKNKYLSFFRAIK